MPQVQRYRRDNQDIAKGKIQAGVKAQIGDMLVMVGNYAVPVALAGTITTLALFKASFVGVLIEGATAGTETKDTDCLIATDGVFEYDLATPLAAVVPVGSIATGVLVTTTVQSQQVASAGATRTNGIGIVETQGAIGDTTLLVRIFPALSGNPLT